MNRSKRRLLQLQETVKMKLALLEKQKQDIFDIIEEYALEVRTSTEQILSEGKDIHPEPEDYNSLMQKLDEASEVFTKIGNNLDAILSNNEDEDGDLNKKPSYPQKEETKSPPTVHPSPSVTAAPDPSDLLETPSPLPPEATPIQLPPPLYFTSAQECEMNSLAYRRPPSTNLPVNALLPHMPNPVMNTRIGPTLRGHPWQMHLNTGPQIPLGMFPAQSYPGYYSSLYRHNYPYSSQDLPVFPSSIQAPQPLYGNMFSSRNSYPLQQLGNIANCITPVSFPDEASGMNQGYVDQMSSQWPISTSPGSTSIITENPEVSQQDVNKLDVNMDSWECGDILDTPSGSEPSGSVSKDRSVKKGTFSLSSDISCVSGQEQGCDNLSMERLTLTNDSRTMSNLPLTQNTRKPQDSIRHTSSEIPSHSLIKPIHEAESLDKSKRVMHQPSPWKRRNVTRQRRNSAELMNLIEEAEKGSQMKSKAVIKEDGNINQEKGKIRIPPEVTMSRKPPNCEDDSASVSSDKASVKINRFRPGQSKASRENEKRRRKSLDKDTPSVNIPRQKPDKDQIMAVTVSDIEHPWSFHVQVSDSAQEISSKIMELIRTHGTEPISPKPDMFCLAKFKDGKYYRAKILSLKETEGQLSHVKVVYIDYGNNSLVDLSDICSMPESLVKQPCQAMMCALSGVCPQNSENMWTEEAILLFRLCTKDRQIRVRFIHPHNKQLHLSLPHLVDVVYSGSSLHDVTSDLTLQSLGSVLIDQGCAKAITVEEQLEMLEKSFTPETAPIKSKDIDAAILNLKSKELKNEQRKTQQFKPKQGSVPLCFRRGRQRKFPLKDTDIADSPDSQSCETDSNKSQPDSDVLYKLSQDVDGKLNTLGAAIKMMLLKTEKRNDLDEPEMSSQESVNSDQLSLADSSFTKCSNLDQGSSENEMEFPVMMSTVISPSSFFVHCVEEESGRAFDQLLRKLNATFEKYSTSALAKLSASFTAKKNSLCCAEFSQDSCFYRGLVLDVGDSNSSDTCDTKMAARTNDEKLLIFFIDFGDFEWTPRRKIYPLPEDLKSVTPMVLWCTLLYVKPSEGDKPDFYGSNCHTKEMTVWPLDVIEKFKSLVCGDKILHAVTSEANVQRLETNTSFQLEPLPVYLLDRNVEGEELCLNHELIYLGLASIRCSPLLSSESAILPESSIMDGGVEDWDPMAEEFSSIRNSYKVNTDDAGVALVGYTPGEVSKQGRKVCVYYNRRRGCLRGKSCPNEHIKVDNNGMTYDKVPVLMFEEDQSDLLPEIDSAVVVTVSTVITPSHFYVTLPWGRLTLHQVHNSPEAMHSYLQTETLEALMDSMADFYRNSRYDGDLMLLAPGQAMAARVRGQWIRAKVIDMDVERSLVQVMSVDFGSVDWVDERELRDLDLRFIHLTPQAVECSMVDLESADESGKWTKEACQYFAELVRGKALVALVKQRYPSGRISIVLYDQTDSGDLNVAEKLVESGLAHRPAKTDGMGLECKESETEDIAGEISAEDEKKKDKYIYMPA